jgi:hypothetical protein
MERESARADAQKQVKDKKKDVVRRKNLARTDMGTSVVAKSMVPGVVEVKRNFGCIKWAASRY